MYNIDRFIEAQEYDYETALTEIKNGKKESHWIWYIFPQLRGLGYSEYSEYYGIDGYDEAVLYLENETLRERLIEISNALLELDENDPVKILGYIDAKKVSSSMTLFAAVDPDEEVFREVLNKYYNGDRDSRTLDMLNL